VVFSLSFASLDLFQSLVGVDLLKVVSEKMANTEAFFSFDLNERCRQPQLMSDIRRMI
jgi:hypothetical protein